MLNASLRRSGGPYIMTIPLSYVEQNHLVAGSRLAIEIIGDEARQASFVETAPETVMQKVLDCLQSVFEY